MLASGTIAWVVAEAIADLIRGTDAPLHTAPMTGMGAACVASTGKNPFTGSATAMITYPVVPDPGKCPETGRHPVHTCGEMNLFDRWIKIMMHLLLYKAMALPGWFLIPG